MTPLKRILASTRKHLAALDAALAADPWRLSIAALLGAGLGGHMLDLQRKEGFLTRLWWLLFRIFVGTGGVLGVIIGGAVFQILGLFFIVSVPLMLLIWAFVVFGGVS